MSPLATLLPAMPWGLAWEDCGVSWTGRILSKPSALWHPADVGPNSCILLGENPRLGMALAQAGQSAGCGACGGSSELVRAGLALFLLRYQVALIL